VKKVLRLFQINLRIQVYDERVQDYYSATIQDVGADSFFINEPMSQAAVTLFMGANTYWQFCLIRDDALYYFESRVIGHKKDQIKLIEVQYPEMVSRKQRRGYYRLPCTLELEYWVVDKHLTAENPTDQKLNSQQLTRILTNWNNPLTEADYQEKEKWQQSGDMPPEKTAHSVDISGGGLQLISTRKLVEGDHLVIVLRLEGTKLLTQGVVVRSSKHKEGSQFIYRVGVKFIDLPEKVRERIVQYVFEQMRHRMT